MESSDYFGSTLLLSMNTLRQNFFRPASGMVVTICLALSAITACSSSEQVADTDETTTGRLILEKDIVEAQTHFIRGITAMQLDDLQAAEIHLTRAHSILPDKAGILFSLADLYFEMGDPVDAIYYNRRAVELEPENRWFRLQLANGYRDNGNYPEAVAQLDSILAYHPNDIRMLQTKAQIHSEQGELEASNEVFQQILDLTGPDMAIYYQRISNFNRMDDTQAIIEELQKVIETDRGNTNALMMLSQFYLEEQKPEMAQQTLERALERNPMHPEALVNLAEIHINNEEWEKAGNILHDLVADPQVSAGKKFEIVQYIIGRFANDPESEPLRKTTGDLVETLLQTEPDKGMSHAMAAEYYLTLGNENIALDHLEQTVEIMPENDAAWRQLIQSYYVQGSYERAVESGKKANEFVPDDAFIHFFVGGSYFLQDQLEEAAAWLKKASELPSRTPFRSIIQGTLGDVYSALELWDQADEAYEEAISLDPDNDVALNNYAFMLSEREKELEQAKEMASRALELSPDNSAFLDTLGWVYFKMGDYENAYEYIRASIETGDASAEVMEHLGDVYDKLGEPDRALYWWQKALEKDESRTYLKERLHIN